MHVSHDFSLNVDYTFSANAALQPQTKRLHPGCAAPRRRFVAGIRDGKWFRRKVRTQLLRKKGPQVRGPFLISMRSR
jgi:hypothetical protein